jgi:hypothetical protein
MLKDRFLIVKIVLVIGIVLLALYVRLPGLYLNTKYRDIYFVWEEGRRIAAGVNPYARVEQSDMIHNEKYPTYLPPIYLVAAFAVKTGCKDFPTFLIFWRTLILIFDIAIGLFLYFYSARRGKFYTGLLCLFIWLFARWGLYVWEIANTESLILLLMILSLYYWDKKPRTAALLFGAALGIKHFGVVLLPVLLARSKDSREGLWRLVYILAVPALLSLPFFLWSPAGFSNAMVFSVVRESGSHLMEDSLSIGILFGRYGFYSRLFLFAVYGIYWIAAIREKWNLWLAAAVAFFLFVSFNPVLYTQYFAWSLPFGLLYLIKTLSRDKAAENKKSPAILRKKCEEK